MDCDCFTQFCLDVLSGDLGKACLMYRLRIPAQSGHRHTVHGRRLESRGMAWIEKICASQAMKLLESLSASNSTVSP